MDVMGRSFRFPLAVSRWRFAEFQYLQPGPPRRLQTVVVYLPDIWTIMPTLEEWEALCQQKAAEAAPAAQEVPAVRRRQTSGGALCPDPGARVVSSSWLSPQETEPAEQAAEASEQAADTSKQNAENPEVTAQQEVDTDLPEAPPPPLEPAVMARSGCVNLSLHGIVEDRRPKERISFEVGVGVWGGWGVHGCTAGLGTFAFSWWSLTDLCRPFRQVMVLAELFLEMLQRDFGYRIYKMLLSLPEKVVAPPEPEKEEVAKEEEVVKEEVAKESKDEAQSEGAAAEPDAPPVSTSAPRSGTGAARRHAAQNSRALWCQALP